MAMRAAFEIHQKHISCAAAKTSPNTLVSDRCWEIHVIVTAKEWHLRCARGADGIRALRLLIKENSRSARAIKLIPGR
jgi:hypothetical protein